MREAPLGRHVLGGVTVLALLLGVLSMHALSGGAHSGPAPPGAQLPAVLAASGSGPDVLHAGAAGSAPMLSHAAASAADAVRAAVAVVPVPHDLPSPDAAAAMCLAMLLSAVLALGFRRWHRHVQRAAPRGPAPCGVVASAARARPPDLLMELCVMRT